MTGDLVQKEPDHAELLHSADDDGAERHTGQGEGHAPGSGWRSHPRQHPKQVATGDEEEDREQQRNETIRVVGTDRGRSG